jgi:hypothetical protein
MGVIYSTAAKTARMTAVRDLIDAGAGVSKLKLGTFGMAVVLVEIPLAEPCGTVSNGALTFQGMPLSGVASADGTAIAAVITDGDGNVIVSGLTVGTANTDIIVNTNVVSTGGTISVTSAVFVHA